MPKFKYVATDPSGMRVSGVMSAASAVRVRNELSSREFRNVQVRERKRISQIDRSIQKLIDDMIETMYAAPGVGLAATQVGVLLRVFVIDLSLGRNAASSSGTCGSPVGVVMSAGSAGRGRRRSHPRAG